MGQSVRNRRAAGLRRKATLGYRGGSGRDDSTPQSGTDRRQDQQAQAREAFDAWSQQLRSVKAACTVCISSVSAHAATRREILSHFTPLSLKMPLPSPLCSSKTTC
jgi:hypothetical protein